MACMRWRVQQRRSEQFVSKVEENQRVMALELFNWPLCTTRTTLKKWNKKSRRMAEKQSEMLLTVPIFRIRAFIKFYGRIRRWRCAGFESLDAWTEDRMCLHCGNIANVLTHQWPYHCLTDRAIFFSISWPYHGRPVFLIFFFFCQTLFRPSTSVTISRSHRPGYGQWRPGVKCFFF